MKNFERPITKDRSPENILTLKEIEQENQELIERAKHELEILKPTFRDLVGQIKTEAPDIIVFMDKGARILAAPLRKYLNETGSAAPEIKFYNDTPLKGHYLRKEDKEFETRAKDDLNDLTGKKVFFIDETFSAGKGAVTLRRVMDMMHLNAKYFALSRDPNPTEFTPDNEGEENFFYYRPMYEHLDELEKVKNDSRFRIYDNRISVLFSRVAANLYITEDANIKTQGRYEPVPAGSEGEVFNYVRKNQRFPHTRAYSEVPENMSWMEYDQRVRDLNMAAVRALKEEILKRLRGQTRDKNSFLNQRLKIGVTYEQNRYCNIVGWRV